MFIASNRKAVGATCGRPPPKRAASAKAKHVSNQHRASRDARPYVGFAFMGRVVSVVRDAEGGVPTKRMIGGFVETGDTARAIPHVIPGLTRDLGR